MTVHTQVVVSREETTRLEYFLLNRCDLTRLLHLASSSSFHIPPLLTLRLVMRKMCPNNDKKDGFVGLETVLEVPVPEEMFTTTNGNSKSIKHSKRLQYCANPWSRIHMGKTPALLRNAELQLLLGVIGAPLIPSPIPTHNSVNITKQDPMEVLQAKYIVRQYIAAMGGERAMESIESMYAMGKVRMSASELQSGGGNKKSAKGSSGGGEMGGFVYWQKRPDLWCLELVVSGCKISAGSDGKVAWRQTPWHPPQASRGPPRPLRRSLQGLDPRSTARLFSNASCIGEKSINGDACFVLRFNADAPTLRARSSTNVEIIRHTVWGYFSHRTGVLVQLDDSHLLRIRSGSGGGNSNDVGNSSSSVYWETTMESSVDDYRHVDGVYIAHSGRTSVSLFRFGDTTDSHTRTRMEEKWEVAEVEFNIRGLTMDCFLPPADLKKSLEQEGCDVFPARSSSTFCNDSAGYVRPPSLRIHDQTDQMSSIAGVTGRIEVSKVTSVVEMEDSDENSLSYSDDD